MSVPTIVSTATRYSVGPEIKAGAGNFTASNAWPAARRVIYVPVYLPVAMTTARFFWVNGGAASGNIDVGVFSSTNDLPDAKIASTGATAVSGTNVLQSVSVSQALSAGQYFLAAMADSTGVWTFRATQVVPLAALGICIETLGAGSTLPTTATPVTAGTMNYIPLIGFSTISDI